MTQQFEVKVPDIGDFSDIPVIEVLVTAGEAVESEQSLLTLESDKATMEIPAPVAGTIVHQRAGWMTRYQRVISSLSWRLTRPLSPRSLLCNPAAESREAGGRQQG